MEPERLQAKMMLGAKAGHLAQVGAHLECRIAEIVWSEMVVFFINQSLSFTYYVLLAFAAGLAM